MRKQRVVRNRIPREIVENEALNRAIAGLPANYNFEIRKTVWRIREVSCQHTRTHAALLLYYCYLDDDFPQQYRSLLHRVTKWFLLP